MPLRPVAPSIAFVFCLALVPGASGAALASGQQDGAAQKDESSKPTATEESRKPDSAGKPKQADEVVVITNEDLERMFADPAAPPPGAFSLPPSDGSAGEGEPALRPSDDASKPAGPKVEDPLKWMQDRQAQQAEWSRQVGEAEQGVSDAQQKVSNLEKRLLATRNPFLARPDIPEDEKKEWAELNAPGRIELTQQQLEQARDELAKAQQKLAQLRSQKPL